MSSESTQPAALLTNREVAVWEKRLEDLAAEYYQAQARYLDVMRRFTDLHTQHQLLQHRYDQLYAAKQRVIDALLPHYPHSLPAEVQGDINFA